jgi:S-adenosylmethionine decarboxylase
MRGTHLIVDLSGVRNIDALKSLDALQEVQRRVAETCKLTVVDTSGFQFRPHGATSVLVLSESHFSIHTWWEQAEAHADIFCCSDRFDATLAVAQLKNLLDAETANWAVVDRPLSSGSPYPDLGATTPS